MNNERENLEKLIEESPLFSIDRETEYAAFKRESSKMIEYLYRLLLTVKSKSYELYGCEITEVAVRCIKNFDSSKGSFLHYFMHAWQKEYEHIRGDENRETQYRGMHISDTNVRLLNSFRRYLRSTGDYDEHEICEKFARLQEISLDKALEISQMSSTTVAGDVYTDDEGNEESLLESIGDTRITGDAVEDSDAITDLLSRVDNTFKSLQQRQKPLVSDMLTVTLLSEFGDPEFPGLSFWSSDILDLWRKSGEVPTQKDIAKKYDRDEASISRTMKQFREKLKQNFCSR